MIYLDNAASGSFKPECVINAVKYCLEKLSVNPGRSSHNKSLDALKLVMDTRESAAEFFGVDFAENVIFTKNCSEALNLAILGTVKEGGEIIITANEHNSVIRPCFELEKQGKIKVRVVAPMDINGITADMIEPYINEKTYMVCVNHVSNVTGATSDIDGIGQLCKKYNLIFLVDAAQSCGHMDINIKRSKINLLAVAPHKGLYAPQGIGLLCINNVDVRPIMFGGTGTESHNIYQPSELPEALECGTLNLPAIAGLKAGLKFLKENKVKLNNALENNFKMLYSAFKLNPMVKLYSGINKCGIITFLASGYDSIYIGDFLNNKYNIAVRCGLHCAPLIHEHLNTIKTGLVRASLSAFNTTSEIQTMIDAIKCFTYN